MLTFALSVAAGPALTSPGVSPDLGWFGGLPVAVPEASSLALLIFGLAAVGVAARRRHARLAAGVDLPGDRTLPAPGNQADAP
jgi:hypothetical protein